ncbi:hypothetical protein TBR22_A39380 [Luteitalea sp. TBR-22]|nr:hypothetical protein TBR22_A39380 [Luteitalea sp. TBR-22]
MSAASPQGVSQSFAMGADGLDGVWLRPLVSTGVPRGELLVDLLDTTDGSPRRVERVVVPAAAAVRDTSLRVAFRPIRASRGRNFRIDLRHVNLGDGPGLDFAASRGDVLPAGRLVAGGVEQWGDLVFETVSRRATLPYWLHEVLRPWPVWARSWPFIVAVLLAFNLVLAWACAIATGVLGEAGDDLEVVAGRQAPAPGAVGRLALGLACAIAAGGVIAAAWPTGRYRSLDLIEALPDAHVTNGWGTLHGSIAPGPVLFSPRIHRGIVAMPPATITWTVDVPRDAVLRLGAAMRQDMWEKQSDGIQMRVIIEHAGERTVGADLTLFPLGVAEHRRLFPLEVPLHRWAGQQVRITLESTPERFGNAVNDVPVWTEPRIEWPRDPAAGVARVVATP